MTFAYDYPILGVFMSMLWFFLFVIWIMILFRVFADIFRSHDMGGFAKTLWIIFVIIVPFLGVLVYVIARGDNMAKHAIEDANAQRRRVPVLRPGGRRHQRHGRRAAQARRPPRRRARSPPAEFEAGKAKILG